MDDLLSKKCVSCEGGELPLTQKQAEMMMPQIPGWNFERDMAVGREFSFMDFKKAVAFVNEVADLAEKKGHHPDILIHGWNHVRIALTTHAINGLSGNDFIVAAKVNEIYRNFS